MTPNTAARPRMNTSPPGRNLTARSPALRESAWSLLPLSDGCRDSKAGASSTHSIRFARLGRASARPTCLSVFGFRISGFFRHSFPLGGIIRHSACASFLRSLVVLAAVLAGGRASAQFTEGKVAKIEIKHVGPQSVSDELIRSNIRVKVGDPYLRAAVDDDVKNLYATGFFYNIRVAEEMKPDGVWLTYVVQGNPRLTEIRFQGNKKFSEAKLRKKLSSKVAEPLDERKLFTDSQEMYKMYQKAGYPNTDVKYVLNIDENAGRGTATFEIKESPKIKIKDIEFVGATAFKQSKLRKEIKTRRHWMFSWLTSGGFLKDEQFQEDKEKLAEFYRDHGYIDFEIKDVKFDHP